MYFTNKTAIIMMLRNTPATVVVMIILMIPLELFVFSLTRSLKMRKIYSYFYQRNYQHDNKIKATLYILTDTKYLAYVYNTI
jgi:hypothetical protein